MFNKEKIEDLELCLRIKKEEVDGLKDEVRRLTFDKAEAMRTAALDKREAVAEAIKAMEGELISAREESDILKERLSAERYLNIRNSSDLTEYKTEARELRKTVVEMAKDERKVHVLEPRIIEPRLVAPMTIQAKKEE